MRCKQVREVLGGNWNWILPVVFDEVEIFECEEKGESCQE